MTTTNSVDIAVEVQEKVKYEFKFSGCNIFNNIRSLMTRNENEIKRSRYANNQMQRFFYVAKCQHISLLYP